MREFLAAIVMFVLVFYGAIDCGIKSLRGKEPGRSLPKKLADKIEEMD